jgi:hypothetical protein
VRYADIQADWILHLAEDEDQRDEHIRSRLHDPLHNLLDIKIFKHGNVLYTVITIIHSSMHLSHIKEELNMICFRKYIDTFTIEMANWVGEHAEEGR